MQKRATTNLRPFAFIALAALALTLAGCGTGPGPTGDGGDSGDGGGDGTLSNPYWVLSEDDGTVPLPERARGTEAVVTTVAGGTQIELTASTPAGWRVLMISSADFADPVEGTDTTLTVTLESPTHTCTITPATEDANDYANLNIVFLEGEPAGALTVITTCDGFDEPDEFDLGTLWYVSFTPPANP